MELAVNIPEQEPHVGQAPPASDFDEDPDTGEAGSPAGGGPGGGPGGDPNVIDGQGHLPPGTEIPD